MRGAKTFRRKARVNRHKGAKGEPHEDTAEVVLREIPHPRGHQRKEPGERQAERSVKAVIFLKSMETVTMRLQLGIKTVRGKLVIKSLSGMKKLKLPVY